MPSLRRPPPSPSSNHFRNHTAANEPIPAFSGFRLPSHVSIAAFVSLSSAYLCYGGQVGTRHKAACPVEARQLLRMASQEPPSSAHVRNHLTPCQRISFAKRLPKVINASTQQSSTRFQLP